MGRLLTETPTVDNSGDCHAVCFPYPVLTCCFLEVGGALCFVFNLTLYQLKQIQV